MSGLVEDVPFSRSQSVFEGEVNSSRIIYKGPPGIEAKDLSTVVYLWARATDESGVEVDTEITVFIPK